MDNFNKQIVTFLDLKGFSNTAIFLKTVTMLWNCNSVKFKNI